jgi:hypothetical protein
MFSLEKLEAFLKDVLDLRDNLDDVVAGNHPNLYADWVVDKAYDSNERVCFNGATYKVLQPHVSQVDWTPEAAPSLFAKVLVSDNPNEVLAWEQPDSTNPYMTGDKVMHADKVWVSIVDNNVWEPGVYGWEEVIA